MSVINIYNGTMTSKKRVLTAFAHQTPDRVPINYMANPEINRKVAAALGCAPDDRIGIHKALGCDFFGGRIKYTGPALFESNIPNGIRVDPVYGIHTRYVEHQSGGYWDYCDFPLQDADEETMANFPMPNPDDFDYDGYLEQFKANADLAAYIGDAGLADVINTTGMYKGMEQTLVDLITDDPATLLFIKRRTDFQLARMERIMDKCKGYVDLCWIGEDLGTQKGPIVGLDLYRRNIKPYHKMIVDLAKSYDLPVMIHSCGSSSWAFEDFIEIGINIVDTLQPEATNMAPRYLKDTYGDRLSFHGAISTAGPMAYGTEQETINNCKEILDIMMPGGGYAFCPTHMIQDNTPLENVLAAYRIAHEFGRY